jgi:hypothetical protein
VCQGAAGGTAQTDGSGVHTEAVPPMSGGRPLTGVAPGWATHVCRRAARLGVGPGEAVELLQRLPVAGHGGHGGHREALAALEAYAARKRVVARLARQGRL